jgi:hypothetical protein
LHWIRQPGSPSAAAWPIFSLGEEPTLHRIRWGDVDGDGKNELVVVPLHGRGTARPDWGGQGARILVMKPGADPTKPWTTEVADDSLHIVHNFIVTNGEIWTASKEGIHALKRDGWGKWSKRKLAEGQTGEIKLGRVNRIRHLATVEPWHGNSIVVYEEPTIEPDPAEGTKAKREVVPGRMWTRKVIDDKLAEAHALGWGDFDGDGSDELAAGWRGKPAYGIALYKREHDGAWSKQPVDDGVAVEDLAVEDLNGDGKPEIIAVGRATANVRIYWNETEPPWVRHEVTRGYANFTAIAADFTGDGKPDVVSNNMARRETWLYVAPDWKPVLLHKGLNVIHTEVFDVDGDGDLDLIGAQHQPGIVFWLERPGDPLKEPWTYHNIDEFSQGGVNGIHGIIKGDVDRDGKVDLIANSQLPNGMFAESIVWFKVPKNPRSAKAWERYAFAYKDAPGLSHYMGFGDVDGDGKPDIASGAKNADGGNWFAWWRQPGDPKKAWTKQNIASNQPGATNIHIVDLNGDKKADFIASRGHGRGVVWYEAPSWIEHEIYANLIGPHSLITGDIDGDGDIDAATCGKDSGIAVWFENDGKGGFKIHHIFEDQSAYDIRLVDMDGDKDLDILIAGQASANVVWFENRLKR